MDDSAKKKILIVDDDPGMTDLLSEFCFDLGYEVMALNDSRQAVEAARTWRPDLMTLDLEMPGLDGLEVLKALKSCEETRGLPVVIISVMAKETAIAADAVQGRFAKPVKFRALMEQIGHLLHPAA